MLTAQLCILCIAARDGLRVTYPQEEGKAMTTPRQRPDSEPLLIPSEVATLFRVDPKTVTEWTKAGKLTSISTSRRHPPLP